MKPRYEPPKKEEVGEISWKNYNPFIMNVNKSIEGLVELGTQMYSNPDAMTAYYISLKNLMSVYSSYMYDKSKIKENMQKIEKFLFSESWQGETREYMRTQGRSNFSPKTKQNQLSCINMLLSVLEAMCEQFATNGLIPTPEKRESEIWEEEPNRSMRERKKAVLDIVFSK